MIFVIRPAPGLEATLQSARELGLAAVSLPLFEVIPRDWELPPETDFDALLAGSANAFRHGGTQLGELKYLPVHAVGEATAQVAREAGFTVERVGEGGLQAVIDGHDKPTKYLRLAGVEHVELKPGANSTILTREVYELRALPITGSAQVGLRAGDPLVLLHSAAAARHFAREVDRLGLDRAAIRLACIGPRVAQAAGEGWAVVESAPQSSDAALLALASDMCH